MNTRRLSLLVCVIGTMWLLTDCRVTYGFKGTSIPPSVKTISIAYFDNKAQLVNPALSNLLTEKLKEKYRKMTRLEFVDEDGDFSFEGDITQYDVAPMGFTADEVGALNRLTIAVKIRFTTTEPDKSFEKAFSKYADFSSERSFDAEESGLVDQITDELIEDIFNATAADW